MACKKPIYAPWPDMCPYCAITDACKEKDCEFHHFSGAQIAELFGIWVSVIMPVYRYVPKLFKEAVGSVLAQTYPNMELIVVSDGCNYEKQLSKEVARYRERHELPIKYYVQEHKGQAVARNEAFKRSVGDYIAYLDADDLWLADHISASLENIITCGSEFHFSTPKIRLYAHDDLGTFVEDTHEYPDGFFTERFEKILTSYNPVALNTVVHTRNLFVVAGGFEPGVVCGEDGVLWRRMIQSGAKWSYSERPTAVYCKYPGNTTQSTILKMPPDGIHLVPGRNGQELDSQDKYLERYNDFKQCLDVNRGVGGIEYVK